jgi:anti-sigma factor RsiW
VTDSTDHFEWDERLQDWIDRDLDPAESAALERHVAGCTDCQARLSAFRAVDATLSGGLPRQGLSEAFDRGVLGRIDRLAETRRAAARARIEREWQTEMRTFSQQWRSALRLKVLNLLLGTALLVVFLMRFSGSAFVARLSDQAGQLTQYASGRPTVTVVVMAVGMSLVALALTRVLAERN